MIKPIVRDVLFLSRKSVPAEPADLPLAQDLQDTLAAHRDGCVGMAANMIGVAKRAIIVSMGPMDLVMFNPVIIGKEKPYQAEEGCLSLDGHRRTTRYDVIDVEYRDTQWKPRKGRFTGWTAEIIQHEIDHCDGILI